MSYNIPEDERPQANKKAQEGLNILASDVDNTLNRVRNLQSETIVDAYNRPVDEPMVRTLSPLEQYAYEPQPVPELGSITEPMARESMVVPQEQPKVLSNFVNQYEAVPQRDMVSVTPYEQAVVDLRDDEVNSLRNDAGEISSSSLEVFLKPLDANKIKILGLADENMKPTKKGELFYNLTNMGMFNEDGTITEKGLAYMTPLKEMAAPEWITQPGNMEKFDLLWQDGVIRSSSTPTEILGAVTKFAGDVVYGAGELAQQQALGLAYNSRTWGGLLGLEDNRPAALKAQSEVSELSVMENVYKNVVGLITMVDVGLATDKKLFEDYVSSPIGAAYEKITGDEFPELRATDRSNPNVKDSEDALVAARHKQWAANQRLADMEAGEIAETFLGIENSVKQAESLKKKIGNDEFKKIYGGVGAFSSVVLDPTNAVPAAFAVKAARSAPLASRAMLNAQNTMGKVAAMELAIAQGDVAVQAARAKLAKVEPTVGLAKRMAESFAERAKVQPNLVEKSQTAANIARRISDEADQIRSALPTITQELEGLVAKRNSLATRIPEAYSQKILQTMEIGRQARSLPAKALGATLEGVGDTISKADTAITNFLQERGLDQIYTAAVGAAGVVGMAGSPVIGTVAAGAAALKSGKVLSSYGKLFRYVGKEMENVRGQIPFWKRVAAHTAPGSLGRGIAHTFNTFDLGGVTSDTLRRTARGVAAALPTDFMFEYLSDGADMRPETLYQAGAESLVIGGSFAAAGGAFMGTKKRMRELSIGDELNFRQNMTDPRQRALFQAIPSSTRRAISTYAIANPTLKYVFKDSGASKYDPNTNTASINVNSTNPIKALVAHETLHHTIIKNNMEAGIAALFLGDTKTNSAGGLFRSKDGTFDPNFEAFKNAYYKRLGAEGMTNAERNAIYPIDKIAVEYFIEKHSDQYASMAESGALGAVASSGAARRKLGSILETVLPRVPVLKDLHFKSGGMIDANGSWVTGNGILDIGGVRRDPITSKMFREMNRRSSGLSPGQFDPLMSDKPDSGAPILLDPSSGIDMELLHPLINVDANGKPILQNGKPVALDRATELSRALGGLTAIEVMQRKRADNYAPEKGEAHIDSEGEFQPGWLSNDVITEMFAKNNYNSEQKRIIREMNRLIKKGTGERVVMINFAATGRNRAGKVVYKPQEATLRDTVPVAVTISEAGNVLFGLMSVTKLNENIQKRAQSRRGKKLYGGNVDLILQDTQAMMEFHKNGTDSIEYFKKYGAVEADERKKFINTMFGLLNKKEQAVLNPMLLEDDVKSRDNVYRTYRADRVSKAVPMSPEEYPAMPFSYESVSQVRMPEQARQMPESLDADYMKAVESGDVEAQQRMVDEAARKAGYDIENIAYHGTNIDFNNFDISDKIGVWTGAESTASLFSRIRASRSGSPRVIKGYIKAQNTAPAGQDLEVSGEGAIRQREKLIADGFDSIESPGKFKIVLSPEQIKSADPITRDDSGNVIPLSQRFNEKSSDIRYMPEPLPQNYKSSRDQTFLKASIGPDGIVNLSRPLKSTEALPPISTRHEYPVEDFIVSKFDKRASILYATNKKGEDVTFKFDPQMMNRPQFADFDQLYNGATVQLAMADRHGATDGDMGGHSFPDLKVNQENIVDDGKGNFYKIVWSNNAWGPVKNMSTKAQKYGATNLLTYNMDQHAHDSNTRTVRIFSNEIENSNLSIADQSTLLIVMNVALKKAQSSASKKTLRSLLKTQKDLLDALKKDNKAKAKGDAGATQLSAEDRLTLENNIEGIKKEIDDETSYLKEALGAKAAGTEEVEVDALFRNYQNKRRAYEKMPTSALKKKSMMDAEKLLKQHQKTKSFKNAEKLLPSRELDKFSNTFKGRKALILAVKNKEASVKWGEFDSQKISQAIGDQLTGDSLHVVSSVELSSDPEFKAVYLGDDPREIARMSQAEQKAALKFKSNPDFVPHEAYLWSMLGPAESKHIFNTNQRSVLESFPDFVDEYSRLPVKEGKFTLNDPNSKASEFNIVNTIRDQSKIGIVFRAKIDNNQSEPETKK